MSRRSRRLATRVCAAAVAATVCWSLSHRWSLRRGAFLSVPPPPPTCRASRWRRLSPPEAPVWDVLVVGGGAVGLYAAVDAAQRGWRVALLDAADFGGGHTSAAPPLLPGAFPFVQRAWRQRDGGWVRRALGAWRAMALWSQCAPRFVADAPTRIPAAHALERAECVVVACAAALLRLLSGPSPPAAQSDGAVDGKGGLVVMDAVLDGAAAALALAQTAESLGAAVLNYAAVTGVDRCKGGGGDANGKHSGDVGDGEGQSHGKTRNEKAANFAVTVTDMSTPGGSETASTVVYTRSILNCAGAWTDEVRQLFPDNATHAVPVAFERYQRSSYMVIPTSALSPVEDAATSHSDSNHNSTGKANRRAGGKWSDGLFTGTAAVVAHSTSYAFSSMMVLPWFDGCVLIGPSVLPLTQLPSRISQTAAAVPDSRYDAQRTFICKALQAAGIAVQGERVLSCLSSVTPVMRSPAEVPWIGDILWEGHHLVAEPQSNAVHVYGGSLAFARDVAEQAVDALLSGCGAFTKAEVKACPASRTNHLALVGAGFPSKTENTRTVQDAEGEKEELDMSPIERVRRFVREDYAVRVEDVIARRTHVAYSSPAEALAAIPVIAHVMAEELDWSGERKAAEERAARDFVHSITIPT